MMGDPTVYGIQKSKQGNPKPFRTSYNLYMRPGIVFIDAISPEYIKQHTREMTEIEPGLTCDQCGSKFRVFAKTSWDEDGCTSFTFEEDKRDVVNRASAAIWKTCPQNVPEGHPKGPKGHGEGVIRLYESGSCGV
jgi:hypothetical protein